MSRTINLNSLSRHLGDWRASGVEDVAYRSLAEGEGAFIERARRIEADSDCVYVQEIARFVQAQSDRQFLTPH